MWARLLIQLMPAFTAFSVTFAIDARLVACKQTVTTVGAEVG